MKKREKKSVSTDDLAVMVARGFDELKKEISEARIELKKEIGEVRIELKKEIGEVRENVKATRRDVLDIGDRFVSRYAFDNLHVRVSKLEQRAKEAKEKSR